METPAKSPNVRPHHAANTRPRREALNRRRLVPDKPVQTVEQSAAAVLGVLRNRGIIG
jgi:hypothetical protein